MQEEEEQVSCQENMQINANLSPLQSQGVKNQSGGILDQNAQCKQTMTHDQYLDNLIED